MNLPADYRWEFIGKAKMLKESNQNFLIAFIVSFVYMYMILAAQFESFVHPITILLALPLTLPFAPCLAHFCSARPWIFSPCSDCSCSSASSRKTASCRSITPTCCAQKACPAQQAIIQANRTRLRPILMTTVMLIAAMIPIALGRGAGSGSRASLAKVVLGGQTLSLLLTLLLTPVAYTIWDDVGRFLFRLFGRTKTAGTPKPEVPQDLKEPSDKRFLINEQEAKKHREKRPAPTISRMEINPEHP